MTNLWRLLPLAALVALAACSGGTTTPPQNRQAQGACPDAAFPGVIEAPPAMAYPASGATGIPDGNFTLQLTYAYGTSLTLAAAGAPTVTASLVSAVEPAPYTVPALRAATTYTVTGYFSLGADCGTYTATLGTFTTI